MSDRVNGAGRSGCGVSCAGAVGGGALGRSYSLGWRGRRLRRRGDAGGGVKRDAVGVVGSSCGRKAGGAAAAGVVGSLVACIVVEEGMVVDLVLVGKVRVPILAYSVVCCLRRSWVADDHLVEGLVSARSVRWVCGAAHLGWAHMEAAAALGCTAVPAIAVEEKRRRRRSDARRRAVVAGARLGRMRVAERVRLVVEGPGRARCSGSKLLLPSVLV